MAKHQLRKNRVGGKTRAKVINGTVNAAGSNNFSTKYLMAIFTAFALVIQLIGPSIPKVLANGGGSIAITSVNNQNSPFGVECLALDANTSITLAGNGSGEAPPGNISQYAVQVDWGDGTQNNGLGTFTPNSGQEPFTFIFQDSHTYTSGGNFNITALLYHENPNGNDNQVSTPIPVCVSVGQQATGSITVVKNAVGGDGKFNFTGSNGIGDFALTTTSGTASTSFSSLAAGIYDITETVPDGWTLTNHSCVYENQSVGVPFQTTGEEVTLGAGDNVTCTFINTIVSGGPSGPQTNFHFIKQICPSYSDIAGNADASVIDETGGHYTEFSNAASFPTGHPVSAISPSEIPANCKPAKGWDFQLSTGDTDKGNPSNLSTVGSTA
ncbi:MAG TPA: hypothetical protein VE973_03965, partial [Candidatus Limnocylindria bacterium]|nr:hypothetical protein [Candidatus Limnocylindria bacterium]